MISLDELAYLRRKRDALCFIPGLEHSRPHEIAERVNKVAAAGKGNADVARNKVFRKIFELEDKF